MIGMNNKLRVLDLFSGIGGFSLGLERTGGFETVAFCEIEEYPVRVLNKHWPGTPVFSDITKLSGPELESFNIDVICGGFPCQDTSYAGKGVGLNGERSGLWFEFARLIKEVGPRWVIIENVSALRSRGFSTILQNLSEIGYDAEWHCIPASYVGAPTQRDRVWVIAYPNGKGVEGLVKSLYPRSPRQWFRSSEEGLFINDPFQPGDCWPTPLLRGVAPRLPHRMDRLKCVGNSVVPNILEMIGAAILEV